MLAQGWTHTWTEDNKELEIEKRTKKESHNNAASRTEQLLALHIFA